MPENINPETIQIDTSTTVIIPFDKKYSHPFGSSFNPATLTQEDIKTIEDLFVSSVVNYNNSLGKDEIGCRIDLHKYSYKKQLVAVESKTGEKIVWVNCLCDFLDSDSWKSEILIIMDGGSCFFNFKINLANREAYDFEVNGVA